MCLNMWSQPLLLQHLVDMRELDVGRFMVGDQILRLEIEDLYLLTGFYSRGETMVLS